MALFSFKKPNVNSPEEKSWFNRLKSGLANTRRQLATGLGDLVLGQRQIDDELFEEIETALLMADVGVEATQDIIQALTEQTSRRQLANGEALLKALRVQLVNILTPISQPLTIPDQDSPYSILVVGVNGAGKTTTIGKLARHLQNGGEKILLAAGDTFRAAAIEQLQTWGKRNDVTVIAQQTGSDCAAVIFDAMQAATARKIDVLIADTAGRLQTQSHLMDELKKVKRVMQKHDSNAPHEVMLVLDASTGQNALVQAAQFSEAVAVTGITLTKLDGTAKGGIVFAIAKQLNIPIRFIGIGEAVDDLQVFDAETFVDALLDLNN